MNKMPHELMGDTRPFIGINPHTLSKIFKAWTFSQRDLNRVCPADFNNHKSKTFLKNKRKGY